MCLVLYCIGIKNQQFCFSYLSASHSDVERKVLLLEGMQSQEGLKVTHATFTQEIGVHVPCESEHPQFFPKPYQVVFVSYHCY